MEKPILPDFWERTHAQVIELVDGVLRIGIKWRTFAAQLTHDFCSWGSFTIIQMALFFFRNPKSRKNSSPTKRRLFDNWFQLPLCNCSKSHTGFSYFYLWKKYQEIASKMLGGMKELILKKTLDILLQLGKFISRIPESQLPKFAIVGKGHKKKALVAKGYLPNSAESLSRKKWHEKLPRSFRKKPQIRQEMP